MSTKKFDHHEKEEVNDESSASDTVDVTSDNESKESTSEFKYPYRDPRINELFDRQDDFEDEIIDVIKKMKQEIEELKQALHSNANGTTQLLPEGPINSTAILSVEERNGISKEILKVKTETEITMDTMKGEILNEVKEKLVEMKKSVKERFKRTRALLDTYDNDISKLKKTITTYNVSFQDFKKSVEDGEKRKKEEEELELKEKERRREVKKLQRDFEMGKIEQLVKNGKIDELGKRVTVMEQYVERIKDIENKNKIEYYGVDAYFDSMKEWTQLNNLKVVATERFDHITKDNEKIKSARFFESIRGRKHLMFLLFLKDKQIIGCYNSETFPLERPKAKSKDGIFIRNDYSHFIFCLKTYDKVISKRGQLKNVKDKSIGIFAEKNKENKLLSCDGFFIILKNGSCIINNFFDYYNIEAFEICKFGNTCELSKIVCLEWY